LGDRAEVTACSTFDEVPIFDEVPANGGATDGTTVYGWIACCDGATAYDVVEGTAAAYSRLGFDGEAPRMNTEDNAGMKGRTCVGVLGSASAGAGAAVCLAGCCGGFGWIACCDGATAYDVIEGTAAAYSRLGFDGEAPRMNTEDNPGMKGRTFVGVLDSASAGAGVVVCLGGRAEVGLGSTGEAMARDAFDHDPIFVRDPARSVNGFAVYDGAATYGVVEGTAAAHS
jgi:hypothetical protein